MLRSLVLVLAFAASAAQAKPVTGIVTFTAHAKPPKVSAWDFDGVGGKVVGDVDDAGKGTLTVKLADIKTGKDGRDEHMREVLQVATYPDAKLTVTSVAGGEFKGDMTIRGVTKPVSGKAALSGTHAKCEFTIKLSDFGIAKIEKMFIEILDDVLIVAEVDAK